MADVLSAVGSRITMEVVDDDDARYRRAALLIGQKIAMLEADNGQAVKRWRGPGRLAVLRLEAQVSGDDVALLRPLPLLSRVRRVDAHDQRMCMRHDAARSATRAAASRKAWLRAVAIWSFVVIVLTGISETWGFCGFRETGKWQVCVGSEAVAVDDLHQTSAATAEPAIPHGNSVVGGLPDRG